MSDGSITFSTKLDNTDLEKNIKQAEKDIDDLKRKIEEKTAERNALAEQMLEVRQAIEQAKEEQRDFDELLDRGVELAEKYNVAEGELRQYNAELESTVALQKRLGKEYAEVYQESGAVFSNAVGSVESRFEKFASKINKRIKKLFVFSFIFGALATFKSYLTSVISEDKKFSASVANLVATLRGVAAPIISVLIPALTSVVNVMTAMITTLAKLVDMVFHTDLLGSISQARQAAQDAANATDEETKATDKLAKAKKKASKYIAAFDELNKMDAKDSQESASSLNSQAENIADAETVNWDAFDVGKINDKLAEIMVILGAALLAVGAILAFSGINIPLGITLMVIGALMVYTAAVEQWDKLPEEVRSTITKIMVIVGSALLVLGAILALSGANIPLGVGMMIAGAAVLATAAILNWEQLPEDIKRTVVEIVSIVSVAFIAIGAILAFSGANIPLGIMLIAVGAAGLVAAAILSWNDLPQNVRNQISALLAIVGTALLVIGIILCITGVGIPVGVACILAGVAGLVGAAAINWDFLKKKVVEIWNGLKQWFNQNVAPIFTAEWWAEKFKSIANGLIYALNQGLAAGNTFINSLLGNISGMAKTFGVNLNWNVPNFQIPYLAQGAVIPPNRKFMAVLGDQTSGTNVEAPESLIRQIVREEAGGMSAAAMQQAIAAALVQVLPQLIGQGGDGDVVMNVDGREVMRALVPHIETMVRTGEWNPAFI